MHRGTVVLLVGIATSLWGLDSRADEREDSDRPVADIVKEERARVEGLNKEQRERIKQRDAIKKQKGFYAGLGVEQYDMPLEEIYRIRAAQRASAPIQFVSPVIDDREEAGGNNFSFNMYVGYEFTSWLGLELTAHQLESFSQWTLEAPAIDSTLAHTNSVSAMHFGMFKERTFSLTALPRWNVNRWFAVYSRLGVGYSENSLSSNLKTRGWTAVQQRCDAEGKNCYNVYDYVKRDVSTINEKYTGTFPMAGLGVQLWDGIFNLEYLYRFDEPIADTTVSHGTIYGRFMVRFRWF